MNSSPAIRFIDLGRISAVRALALEEAMLDSPGEFPETWCYWTAESRCIVLGTARPWRQDLLAEEVLRNRVPVFRRRSGGGSVVIGEGSPAVTMICGGSENISEAYRRFCRVMIAVFERLGLEASFERPADLAVGGRKIAGLAQRRRKKRILVTASVLAESMADHAARLLNVPSGKDAPGYRQGRDHGRFMTSLRELGLSRPAGEFSRALREQLADSGGACAAPGEGVCAAAAAIEQELLEEKWIYRL